MSLRLQRRKLKTVQTSVTFQPRAQRLAIGQDLLTKTYGSYPYSFNLWDVLKGLIYGGLSYGLLTVSGASLKSVRDVAWKAFLLGGTAAGMEQTLDQALFQVYGYEWDGTTAANFDNLIHEALQGFLFDGAISAGFAALLASI